MRASRPPFDAQPRSEPDSGALRVGRRLGQGVEQPAVAVEVGRQMRLPPAAVVEQQIDAATGAENEVGHRAGGLHGELEVGLRRLADDPRRRCRRAAR